MQVKTGIEINNSYYLIDRPIRDGIVPSILGEEKLILSELSFGQQREKS